MDVGGISFDLIIQINCNAISTNYIRDHIGFAIYVINMNIEFNIIIKNNTNVSKIRVFWNQGII